MISRRAFVVIGAVAVATPLVAGAQQPGRVPRIGVLRIAPLSEDHFRGALLQGLRDHGYAEGQNIFIEWRSAEGLVALALALADELVRLDVDLIVAVPTPAVHAVRRATRTIPIVIVAGDPVRTGFVASLARPGGNVTGIAVSSPDLTRKRFELLKEVSPELRRVGVLSHGADPFARAFVDETAMAATAAGIELRTVSVRSPEQLEGAFATMTKGRAGAVIVQNIMGGSAEWPLAPLTVKHRLPSISEAPFAQMGGLMSYGPDLPEVYRRSAFYVDKILKGAKPADLPLEQPTKFELVINLKTAKALGLTIPPSMLARADKVIQ